MILFIDYKKKIDEKFTRLPVRYFDEQSRGDLLSRATMIFKQLMILSHKYRIKFSQPF